MRDLFWAGKNATDTPLQATGHTDASLILGPYTVIAVALLCSLVLVLLSVMEVLAGHPWFIVAHGICLYGLLLAIRQRRHYAGTWVQERYGRLIGMSMLLSAPTLIFIGAMLGNTILPELYPLYSPETLNTLYVGINITAFATVVVVDLVAVGFMIIEIRILTAGTRSRAGDQKLGTTRPPSGKDTYQPGSDL